MPKEILDITASGGVYCLVSWPKAEPERINCARPNGFVIGDILNQFRLQDGMTDGFLTDGDILRWGLAQLCETALGRALAHDARFDGWMIALEDGDEPSLYTDNKNKCVTLSRFAESLSLFAKSGHAQAKFLFHLAKALRLIWQKNSDSDSRNILAPVDFILRERLIEADGDLCAILCAYQLREQGQHELWRSVLSSDLNGLAVTLCECLQFEATEDGLLDAMGFVFQDWFVDECRLSRVDHNSLSKLDEKNQTPDGQAMQLPDVVHIGMLPDGFSYLEYAASDLLTDSYFSHIPDPVNDAHLKQILCESQVDMIKDIGFRDADLARKIFPHTTFEAVV